MCSQFNEFHDVTDEQLIRQWWYDYARLLRGDIQIQEFQRVAIECEQRGIIRPGRMMTRNGAGDLADQCDQLRRVRLTA